MPCKHCQDEAEYVIKDGQFAKIGTDMDGCHLHVFLVSSKWSFSSLLWRVPVSFCPWCGHYLGGEMETEITGCEFLGYSQNNLPRVRLNTDNIYADEPPDEIMVCIQGKDEFFTFKKEVNYA